MNRSFPPFFSLLWHGRQFLWILCLWFLKCWCFCNGRRLADCRLSPLFLWAFSSFHPQDPRMQTTHTLSLSHSYGLWAWTSHSFRSSFSVWTGRVSHRPSVVDIGCSLWRRLWGPPYQRERVHKRERVHIRTCSDSRRGRIHEPEGILCVDSAQYNASVWRKRGWKGKH